MRSLVIALLLGSSAIAQAQVVSPVLYLNRCRNNCTIVGDDNINDARAMKSTIPCAGGANCGGGGCSCAQGSQGNFTIEEFRDGNGNVGAAADAEWNAIVQCVKEVYSPYAITVTDVLPPGGQSHNQGILAGRPQNIGYTGIGGIAPGTCAPKDNVISFSFSNSYTGSGMDRVWGLCGIVAQETAHAYGLDHAFKFSDGRPACSDPMTYLPDCGQKFFRNDNTTCGEFAERPCACGGAQNSHKKILAIFGPGTPITRPPTLLVTQPANGATVANGAVVAAQAGAQRGIFRMELWINGYKWVEMPGAAFGSSGQPTTTYSLLIPQGVPNSILDIVVKAYDDIEVEAVSPTITVTKGAACTDSAQCDATAKGMVCGEGKCYWEPATGEVGDSCTYDQFCVTNKCLETTEGSMCSQDCIVGTSDSCPADFTCEPVGNSGFCLPKADTGCCSVGAGPRGRDYRGAALLSLFVLGVVLRRRRSRR